MNDKIINTILQGNSWDLVNEIDDDSLDLIFTSPAYYRLRDYFVDDVIIGDNECEHDFNEFYIKHDCGKTQLNNKEDGNFEKRNIWERNNYICKKCGAFKGQFGLEPHPKLYIKNLVNLFELLKPKLKKTGNLVVNLGDTFAGSNGKSSDTKRFSGKEIFPASKKLKEDVSAFDNYYKPKQKLLIPHRFAIAMQDNGWYCRGDWVWSKPNGLPSSANDRLTVKKEFVFHFTKHKDYYFDLDSIKIKTKGSKQNRDSNKNHETMTNIRKREEVAIVGEFKNPCDVLGVEILDNNYGVVQRKGIIAYRNLPDIDDLKLYLNKYRKICNLTIDYIENNVFFNQAPHHWFNGESYPSKEDWLKLKSLLHFDDTFDEQMITEFYKPAEKQTTEFKNPGDVLEFNTKSSGDEHYAIMTDTVAEFALKCCCPENGTVLDPFMGAGTTGFVAKKQNKNYIGFELSPKYIEIANKRINSVKKIGGCCIIEKNENQQLLFNGEE